MVLESLTNLFIIIWDWLLYNILIPVLIIAYVGFFIYSQYLLIRVYIYIFKNVYIGGIKFYNYLKNNKIIKTIITDINEDLRS